MKIHFVLVEPKREENVGAAARAMNTMGFQDLILVRPCELTDKARHTAHGSSEILKNSRFCDSLVDAVQGFDYVVGTTASYRDLRKRYHSSDELASSLRERQSLLKKVAIVFGRECSGLTNDEFNLCDAVSNIPQASAYPAINLGQSVMIYAYLLRGFNFAKGAMPEEGEREPAEFGYRFLKERVQTILEKVEISSTNRSYRKIIGRLAELKCDDVQLLHYLCEKINNKIK